MVAVVVMCRNCPNELLITDFPTHFIKKSIFDRLGKKNQKKLVIRIMECNRIPVYHSGFENTQREREREREREAADKRKADCSARDGDDD